MKKLTCIYSLIFAINTFAGEFYIYHSPQSSVPGEKIYSGIELAQMKRLGIDYQVTKITTDKTLEEVSKEYSHLKVEPVQNFELYDYSNFQWHLNNPGGTITRRITDIDVVEIQATAGEDIQNIADQDQQNKKVRVAVIDSGVDTNHPELKDLIVTKPSECAALQTYKACLSDRNTDNEQCQAQFANIDTDGDGYPLDCQGWSVTNTAYPGVDITGNPEINDEVGHGTHIAGIIAAPKDGIGINGIADNIEILPVQVAMNSATDNPIDNIAKGVLYALENNAQVINLSLGWRFQFETTLMRDVIKAAIDSGVAVVVAAGNDAHSDMSYPCAYDDVICVGASDQTGNLASFSNRGTSVDIIAPGVEILSTWPTNIRSRLFTQDYNYEYMSGTSQAAPIVTGLVAKLMSRGWSSNQAKIKLFKGAREKREKSDIRFGNIDYARALQADPSNFLYPAQKEAALILYKNTPANKVRIKIKNLGLKQNNVPIRLESQSDDITVLAPTTRISKIEQDEIFEIDFDLQIKNYLESEHRFTLYLGNEKFTIRANIVRVIRPESDESNIESVIINGVIDDQAVLRPFEDVNTQSAKPDFLTVTQKNNTTTVNIVAFQAGHYSVSRNLPIRDVNPVFLNFSKVDLELDGSHDYVVTYVVSDREGNKTSKFLAFNADLTPKRIFITPGNQYDNEKTFLPGKFKWLLKNGLMRPYWIGFGENGSEISRSPWEPAGNTTSNYVYYLDSEKGLQHESLDTDHIPLHFLYQSGSEMAQGEAYFLASKGVGFLKEYHLYKVSDGELTAKKIQLNNFFDVFEPRPLPLLRDDFTESSHGFFNESSNGGSQIILSTYVEQGRLENEVIRLENIFESENIKFIKTVSDKTIFYQTEHKIAVFDRDNSQHYYRESKVNASRRRLEPLDSLEALYMPSREAPNFTSEILYYQPERGLVSLAAFRILTIGGCENLGKIKFGEQESLGFICAKDQKLLFLPIEL